MNWFPFLLAGILVVTNFLIEWWYEGKRVHITVVSFSAGVAISYLLLILLPEIAGLSAVVGRPIFFALLLGFISIHSLEKYIWMHRKKRALHKAHKHLHVVFTFVYAFLIGMVLDWLTIRGPSDVLLFFVPFLLYQAVEIIPEHVSTKRPVGLVAYLGAPVYGVLLSQLVMIPFAVYAYLLSFVGGVLLYILIREIPPAKHCISCNLFTKQLARSNMAQAKLLTQ